MQSAAFTPAVRVPFTIGVVRQWLMTPAALRIERSMWTGEGDGVCRGSSRRAEKKRRGSRILRIEEERLED